MVASPARILVVDDSDANRMLLKHMLEGQGYCVTSAADGAAALALLRTAGFDLILLDIMMPGTDGYDVLMALGDEPELNSAPVVMVSALGDHDSIARCITLGATDYLVKPINQTLLKARVEACLAHRRAQERERARGDQIVLIAHQVGRRIATIIDHAEGLLSPTPAQGPLSEAQSSSVRAICALAAQIGEALAGHVEAQGAAERQAWPHSWAPEASRSCAEMPMELT